MLRTFVRHLFVTLATLLLFTQGLFAQHAVGFEFDFGLPGSISHLANVVNRFGTSGNGTGSEQSIRVLYDYDLDLFAASPFELKLSAALGYRFGSFTSDAFADRARQTTNTFSLSNSTLSGRLAAQPTLSLGDFKLGFGVWIAQPISQLLEERLLIVSPASTTFANGARDTVIAGTAQLSEGSLPYGLRFETGYHFQIADNPVAATVFTDLDLLAYRSLGFSALKIGAGFKFLFPVTRDSNIRHIDTTVVQARVTPHRIDTPLALTPALPWAMVQLEQSDKPLKQSTPVRVMSHDTLYREYVMMPSSLKLAEDGGISKEFRLCSAEEANTFSLASLAQMGEIDITRNMLAVIGYRLRRDPSAKITISAPAKARTQLQEYFTQVWDLNLKQVRLESGSGITLRGEPASLLDPVAVQWIERTYEFPDLKFHFKSSPAYSTRILALTQDAKYITDPISLDRYAGEGATVLKPSTHSHHPIVASLSVTDSLGRSALSRDTVWLAPDIPVDSVLANSYQISRFVFLKYSSKDPSQHHAFAKLLTKAKALKSPSMEGYLEAYESINNYPQLRRMADEISTSILTLDAWNLDHVPIPAGDLLGDRVVLTIEE